MQFGHLENGRVIPAEKPITVEGRDYFTEDAALMLAAGEKEIVETEAPAPRADGVFLSSWRETDTQIIREWTFSPYPEEARKAHYESLVVRYIRECYSANDENEILREFLAYGETHKASFDEYNTYVESCKTRAHQEIYGE